MLFRAFTCRNTYALRSAAARQSRHHRIALRAVDRWVTASPNPERASHAAKLAVERLCVVKRRLVLFVFRRSFASAVGAF